MMEQTRLPAFLARPASIFGVSFLISFLAVVPWTGTTISWTDAGELITTSTTLGIAHPTGYPLFTMLSRVVLILIPWIDPVLLLNTLSGVFVAGAAGCVSLIAETVLRGIARREPARLIVPFSACGSAILFVTIPTIWDQGVSYEVYGFQALLYGLSLLLFLTATEREPSGPTVASRWWPLTGFLLGLSFSNHMMTMYLLPGIGWMLWKMKIRIARSGLVMVAIVLSLGLSPYIFLLLRSSSDPLMNWGDPSTIGGFLAHVTARQYRVWMFPGVEAFGRAARIFFAGLPDQIGWAGLFFLAAGFVRLWKTRRDLVWFFLILMVFTLAYSFNYEILDIGPYFTLFYVVSAIMSGIGVWSLARFVESKSWTRGWIIACGAIVLLIGSAWYRAPMFLSPDETSPEPFASQVLEHVEPGGTIITEAWDFLYSPLLALQHVRGERPDVRVIDIHLLRDRSWYVAQTLSRMFASDEEVRRRGEAFLVQLRRFENGLPFDPEQIRGRYNEFLSALLAGLMESGPVYMDQGAMQEFSGAHPALPEGFLLRVYLTRDRPVYKGLPKYVSVGSKNDEFARYYRRFCSTALLHHAAYVRSIGDTSLSQAALEEASQIDPSNPLLAALR